MRFKRPRGARLKIHAGDFTRYIAGQRECGYDDGPRIEGRPHPLQMDENESSYDLTPEERRELADYAISLWERYAKEGPQA